MPDVDSRKGALEKEESRNEHRVKEQRCEGECFTLRGLWSHA